MSNSSSSSFIIFKEGLSEKQIEMIHDHISIVNLLYDQGTQKKIGIGLVSYYIFRQLSIFNLIFLIFLFFAGKKYYEDMKESTRRHQGLEQ